MRKEVLTMAKRLDFAIENLKEFDLNDAEYKAFFPKFFEYKKYVEENETTYVFKIWNYRFLISVEKVVYVRKSNVKQENNTIDIKNLRKAN